MNGEDAEARQERYWQEDLRKIQELRASGRLWRARDFALAVMKRRGYREELSRTIAEIFYEMKDTPRAGLYWLTTPEDSEMVRAAIDCSVSAYGSEVPRRFRKPLRCAVYPEEIARRLDEAIKRAGVLGGIDSLNTERKRSVAAEGCTRTVWIACAVPIVLLLLILSGAYFWLHRIL